MLSSMPPCRRAFRRIAPIALLTFAFHWLQPQQASTKVSPAAPLVIEGLGKGTFPLSGPWQFHPGDDKNRHSNRRHNQQKRRLQLRRQERKHRVKPQEEEIRLRHSGNDR